MSIQTIKKLSQRPIAYYPIYREITGSTTAGILLSQLMYWFSKKDKIFKTDKEIMDETKLTEKELRNAKKLIKNLDFITVSVEGIPAKTFYEIKWDLLEVELNKNDDTVKTSSDVTVKQVSPKGQDCDSPKGETNKNNNFNTEITTEITSYTKKNIQKNKTQFPKDDQELQRYALDKAATKGIKCPITTYEAFRDHHTAKGSKFVDWRAAFNTWVGNFFKYEAKNEYETIQVNPNLHGTYDYNQELLNVPSQDKVYKLSKDEFIHGVVVDKKIFVKN